MGSTNPHPTHDLWTWRHPGPWILYLALLGLVIGGLFFARNEAYRTYGTDSAQSQWDTWRSDAQKMASSDGPVRRRLPKSPEPPALVLMRDYFAVCATIAVVLSTVLFGTALLFIRGVMLTPSFVDRSLPGKLR